MTNERGPIEEITHRELSDSETGEKHTACYDCLRIWGNSLPETMEHRAMSGWESHRGKCCYCGKVPIGRQAPS